jgi:NTE family protein
MIGLALSGGGSRAMAFHLGCLRALKDLGLLDKVDGISTISGGSVIGAYYAYTPDKTFDEFEQDIRKYLRKGFQKGMLLRSANPINVTRGFWNAVVDSYDLAREKIFQGKAKVRLGRTRTDLLRSVLQKRLFEKKAMMSSPRRGDMHVVIGAADLVTESGFRFGEADAGSWRLGRLVDGNVDVALAVAASAAYPIFLPAIGRQWRFKAHDGTITERRVLLTDGGIYDNLGFRVFLPGRDPKFSIHTFPCDYIIACNAGHGLAGGDNAPNRFYGRVETSFSMVHRLVGNGAMQELHQHKDANRIKGFILPYLGQQDGKLPTRPADFVPREAVIDYPTNFGAMPEESLNALFTRGRQLTELLARKYVSELLS